MNSIEILYISRSDTSYAKIIGVLTLRRHYYVLAIARFSVDARSPYEQVRISRPLCAVTRIILLETVSVTKGTWIAKVLVIDKMSRETS